MQVFRWSGGSFLEDQDHRWIAGIPREVYLYSTAARHLEDVFAPEVYLHLDARHRGLGTASCGPDTLPRYRLPGGACRSSCALCPWAPADGDPGERARALAVQLLPAKRGR